MFSKAEVDMLIAILKSVISLIESIDPNASQSKVLIDVQNALNTLQALGL